MTEDTGTLPDLQTAARLLGGEVGGGEIRCPTPGHSATDRGLSVKIGPQYPGGILVHSFNGGDRIACLDHVRQKLSLPAFKPNGGRPRFTDADIQRAVIMAGASAAPKRKPIATFDYTDADGKPLYQVLKYDNPKTFRQRRPDGNGGGWIWNLDGVRRVLYRWPELLQFSTTTTLITEGEKDSDRLWSSNMVATTVASGTWDGVDLETLRDRELLILEDSDEAGVKRALEAATVLHPIASYVKIVRLPGLAHKEDVSNWLDKGHTAEELNDFCNTVPVWEPASALAPQPTLEPPEAKEPTPEIISLPFINIAAWDDEPVPEQEWSVHNRFPLRQAVLFSGEGAAGKSTIYLHLCAAHVLGKDWLGGLPEPGPALFIEAEDGADVMHRRISAVANHFNATFSELAKAGLNLISLAVGDAVIAAATRSGKIEPTPLFNQILEAVGDIRPKMIGIASSANVYAGSEIDRSQVQQFVSLLTRLAMVSNGTCHLISHPSLTGISSDTGLSGNTQWHNAVRARCYLKSARPEAGEQPDTDLRELVFKKNNYGPVSENIVLRYQSGLFLPIPGIGSLDKVAQEAKADEVFLDLLSRFNRENRSVNDKTGPSYAPAIFSKEDEARRAGLNNKNLEAAMRAYSTPEKSGTNSMANPLGRTIGWHSRAKETQNARC